MKGLFIVLGILVAIALLIVIFLYLPLHISVCYTDSAVIKVKLLFFSYTLYPEKKKFKKAKKKETEILVETTAEAVNEEEIGFFSLLGEMLSFYRKLFESVVLPILRRIGKHLTIEIKKMNINIAGEDAAKAAIRYGAACTALNGLFAFLSEYCTFKMGNQKDVGVFCRYDLTRSDFSGEIVFTVRILYAIKILITALMNYIKEQEQLIASTPAENNQKTERKS